MTPQKKIVYDISASAVQVLVSQLSGAVIFYLLSRYLDKSVIGSINWSIALLMIIFGIAGCGIDQIAVKKVATGSDPVLLLKSYCMHVLLTGMLVIGVLVTWRFLVPLPGYDPAILLLLGVSQFLLYLSSPFKQVANGLERFRLLMIMSITANVIRVAGLTLLILSGQLTIRNIILLYILSSLFELSLCLFLYVRFLRLPFQLEWNKRNYTSLLKESLPQLGVIICNTAIARFDWVMIGILSSSVFVAEYSFAYKFFELSTLPLLIIGPLLLPRIARMCKRNEGRLPAGETGSLVAFMRIEIVIAVLIALIVNICWTPVIDLVTDGKYGASTAVVTCILSMCVPFLYVNNILWSVSFSEGKTKKIFFIFLATCLTNIILDLLLIPFWKNEGAAVAFVLAILVQTAAFLQTSGLKKISLLLRHLVMIGGCAAASFTVAAYFSNDLFLRLAATLLMYAALLIITKQIRISDGFFIRRLSVL